MTSINIRILTSSNKYNTHFNTRLRLSKKKKKSRKKIDKFLPYEDKSINDSDEEWGGKVGGSPYSSALPGLAKGINKGSKKSETRNL